MNITGEVDSSCSTEELEVAQQLSVLTHERWLLRNENSGDRWSAFVDFRVKIRAIEIEGLAVAVASVD